MVEIGSVLQMEFWENQMEFRENKKREVFPKLYDIRF